MGRFGCNNGHPPSNARFPNLQFAPLATGACTSNLAHRNAPFFHKKTATIGALRGILGILI